MKKFYFRSATMAIALLMSCYPALAQHFFDLNENPAGFDYSARRSNEIPARFLQSSKQIRPFAINPVLGQRDRLNKNDVIRLSLFDNKQYEAKINRIDTDVNGTVSVTGKLTGYPASYLIVTINSNGESLLNVEIPELSERYSTRTDLGSKQYYLAETDPDHEPAATCGGAVIAEAPEPLTVNESLRPSSSRVMACTTPAFGADPTSPATIRLLVVYTADAAGWASVNATGIHNLIASGIALTNTVWSNSEGNATLELAHSAQVGYEDSNQLGLDLERLQNQNDGYLDEIHQLRKLHDADLVTLVVRPSGTNIAGIAFLLNSPGGAPQIGFSTIAVNTFNSYVTAHEIGHNLGMEHDVENANEIFPPIVPYAFGWRWTGNDSNTYRSVMAYAPGARIGRYSDPTHTFQGAPTGNDESADNARLFREMKHVIADYKTKVAESLPNPENLQVLNVTEQGALVSWDAVPDAFQYRMYFYVESDGWYYFTVAPQFTGVNFDLPELLQAGTTYPWFVAARTECQFETHSVMSNFTTSGSLPVTLSHFTAARHEQVVQLHWTTVAEVNAGYFDLERSGDGASWHLLAKVNATGTADRPIDYQFQDHSPLSAQNNYYRLRMIDLDGTSAYSQIASVVMPGSPLVVYPTPANAYVRIRSLNMADVESYSLVSTLGIEVQHGNAMPNEGVAVTGLQPGPYWLRIRHKNGGNTIKKIVVSP